MPDGKTSTPVKPFGSRFRSGPIAPIPMEWMGPPAWRLPSGKALAEFALQAGFLAPLLLDGPPVWPRGRTPLWSGAPPPR